MKINDVNLGEFVYNLLTARGVSQRQFAKELGIKPQNVKRDIFDKKSLDTDLLRRISEYFDVNLFELFISDNQIDYTKKDLKATVIIELGEQKAEKTFTVCVGKNKLKIE